MTPAMPMTEKQHNGKIPIEYIVSEMVAFPIASSASFKSSLTRLDPDVMGETGELWREAERYVTRAVSDLSIDMALAIRDHFWFGVPPEARCGDDPSLSSYLRRLNETFLELKGDHAVPQSPAGDLIYHRERNISSANRNNRMLRWLSYSLPVDLLLGCSACRRCPPSRVEYAPSQIYQNLKDHGLAESHLHVGAAMKFPEYWVAVLNRLASHELPFDGLKSPGAEMNEGRDLVPWLLRAALARLLLVCFLYTEHDDSLNFRQWLYDIYFPSVVKCRSRSFMESIIQALEELQAGRLQPYRGKAYPHKYLDFNHCLRSLYGQMINSRFVDHLNNHPDSIHLCDPIAPLTRYTPGKSPNPEICFMHRSMTYFKDMKAEKKEDALFARLFWQVVRLRCLFYRHVTQRPMTPGLLWFIRHYDRMSPGRRNVDTKLLVRSAAVNCGLDKGLKALEVRRSLGDSVSEMLEMTHNSIESLHYWRANRYMDSSLRRCPYPMQPAAFTQPSQDSARKLEFAWILHIEKLRGDASRRGLDKPGWKYTTADPRQESRYQGNKWIDYLHSYRYANYYRQRKHRAMLLGRLLIQFPRSLKVLRGLDVCTDELGVPGWVVAPMFRYLTEVGKSASLHLKNRFGEEVPALRKTAHAGEDFVHLLGGLRRIDEAVRFLKLGAGDRIGHAMALGTHPELWANRTGRVAMRLEDRLFDLVWEWSQYSRHIIANASARNAYVEREISRLSEKIFNLPLTPYQLEKLTANLYDERMLKQVDYPDKVGYKTKRLEQQCRDIAHGSKDLCLLKRYLEDPNIFERGHQVEWFNVTPEVETMTALQNHLRKTIGSLGIVVEVNPSSNLLIGNIADLKNHPFWRLDPPLNGGDTPRVALCIGSDDPLTFATDLRREYALVYESLIDGGLSAAQAWEWVDRIRRTGLSSRFTLDPEETTTLPQKQPFDYNTKYRPTDRRMPRSYWTLDRDMDRYIEDMP